MSGTFYKADDKIKDSSKRVYVSSVIRDKKYGLFRFASCGLGEVSMEHSEVQHGIFMHFIIKGLQGAADQRESGKITLDDLYQYVHRETQDYVEKNIPSAITPQTPTLLRMPANCSQTAGDVLLGFRPVWSNVRQPVNPR